MGGRAKVWCSSFTAPLDLVGREERTLAVYPCSTGSHRYPQAQQSAYLIRVYDGSVETSMARFCPKHFRDFAARAEEMLFHVEDDTQNKLDCQSCEAPTASPLFVRLFPAKAEELILYLDLCTACAANVADALQEGSIWTRKAPRTA